MKVSIVIATFGRHDVLAATIRSLLELAKPADELVVVDQNPSHPDVVADQLAAWEAEGAILRLVRAAPSIPGAMNDGLLAANGDIVLYLDDDIVPCAQLVAAHQRAHRKQLNRIVAGQLLQPGEFPEPLVGAAFSYRSSVPQEVAGVIGANFSVGRQLALSIGGFDENFVSVAYRFEADFCDRARAAGATIWFEPAASARHLKVASGGTRSYGDHLRTWQPSHAVGEYYYLLNSRTVRARWRRIALRPLRAVRTRHHLLRPWWIPVTLVAEARGLIAASRLARRGPRLLAVPERTCT